MSQSYSDIASPRRARPRAAPRARGGGLLCPDEVDSVGPLSHFWNCAPAQLVGDPFLGTSREVSGARSRLYKGMSRRLRMLDDGTRLVELTTRTQHGRFLLLPSEKANDIILGVLGRAQAKYDVALHAYNFQVNHEHLLGSVEHEEQMSLFMGYLNGNLAKELGRLHDWREKFWGRRYHSASVSLAEEDQIRRFMYILDNELQGGPRRLTPRLPRRVECAGTVQRRDGGRGHVVRPDGAVPSAPSR